MGIEVAYRDLLVAELAAHRRDRVRGNERVAAKVDEEIIRDRDFRVVERLRPRFDNKALGETLTLGDLRVTAEGVERGEVRMRTPGFAKPDRIETVKLRLHLKNVSKDNFFFGIRAVDRNGNRSPVSFPSATTT